MAHRWGEWTGDLGIRAFGGETEFLNNKFCTEISELIQWKGKINEARKTILWGTAKCSCSSRAIIKKQLILKLLFDLRAVVFDTAFWLEHGKVTLKRLLFVGLLIGIKNLP